MVTLVNQSDDERQTISDEVWRELLDMAHSEGWLDTHNLWNPKGQTVPEEVGRNLADAVEKAGLKGVGGASQPGIELYTKFLRRGAFKVN